MALAALVSERRPGPFRMGVPYFQVPQMLHSGFSGVASCSNQISCVLIAEVISGEGALQAPACRGQCIFFSRWHRSVCFHDDDRAEFFPATLLQMCVQFASLI